MITATASSGTEPITLYTIAMSHFSEKIRWLLDAEGLPYREVALTPVFHVLPALRMGGRGRTTVPVLRIGGRTKQDSTRIIEWLADRPGGLAMLPPSLRGEIMALEHRFDAIGDAVVRYLYQKGFAYPDFIMSLWTRFASPGQTRFIHAAYPVVKQVFKVKLWINDGSARQAQATLDEALRWLEARLADGRQYLVDGRFTVADIAVASLLAPLACPPEHAVYGDPAFRDKLVASGGIPADRPALAWVREMYARHRGAFWRDPPRCA